MPKMMQADAESLPATRQLRGDSTRWGSVAGKTSILTSNKAAYEYVYLCVCLGMYVLYVYVFVAVSATVECTLD